MRRSWAVMATMMAFAAVLAACGKSAAGSSSSTSGTTSQGHSAISNVTLVANLPPRWNN